MKTNPPTHQEVARRAHEIWQAWECPNGRDTEIWYEAERQLSTPVAAENAPSESRGRGNGNSQRGTTAADPTAANLKHGQLSGHPIPSPSPIEVAALAALQKKQARTPQLADAATSHPPTPPQSGKPVWDKPHSR